MTRQPEYADPQRYIELAGFTGSWRDLWWNRDFLELMVRRLELDRARRVLDVGCGAGHWGRSLLPHLHADAKLAGGGPRRALPRARSRGGGPGARRVRRGIGGGSRST